MLGPNSSWRTNTWLHGALLHAPPSACRGRHPTPTGSPLQCNPCLGAPITRLTPRCHCASSIHPHTTSLPTFRLRPQSQPPSAWTFPHLPARLPRTMSRRCTRVHRPRLPFHPRRLCASHFLSCFCPLTTSLHFSPTPPQTAPLCGTHSRPGSPARPPLSRALVRLLQLEGDGGPERLQTSPGSRQGLGESSPAGAPGPSATRPPGTSASAARCGPRHRPPAGRTARPPRTHSEPCTAPNPWAAAVYLPYGAETAPSAQSPTAYGSPDPSFQPIRPLDLPLPEDDWLICLAIQLQDFTSTYHLLLPNVQSSAYWSVRKGAGSPVPPMTRCRKGGASICVPGSMQIRHVTSGKVGAGPGPRRCKME